MKQRFNNEEIQTCISLIKASIDSGNGSYLRDALSILEKPFTLSICLESDKKWTPILTSSNYDDLGKVIDLMYNNELKFTKKFIQWKIE